MPSAFYIAPESSIKYTIVGPSGARAVLNDPSDSDFVGYLDGEEAITGIDSPEIRDSYSDLADNDGGLTGSNLYSRRPVVMNGKIFPTSAADRNTKLGKLMEATDARFADGTLTWTPTGGEPVFLRFRRQLPFRAKGGFNKDFQIGLVANDPRIYSVRTYHSYVETNGNSGTPDHRRFTWASGSGTSLASRNFYIPPGTWDIHIPIRRSTASGTITLTTSNSTGTNTPLTLGTGWQNAIQTRVTANAANVATTLTLTLNAALTTGQWVEVGNPVLTSPDGLTIAADADFATNWTAGSGYTASFVTATPPAAALGQPGNSPARPLQRLLGPFTSGSAAANALNLVTLGAAGLTGSDYAVIDYANRTILKNNSTTMYGLTNMASSWGGLRPYPTTDQQIIYAATGATTATRMETYWRGTWL